ncbi:MAG: gliding motility-associated protein GldE [Bacteroidales bacterium]
MEDIDLSSIQFTLGTVTKLFQPFTWEVLIGLIVFIILLICSALISGSEIAFFALSPKDEEEIKKAQNRTTKLIKELLKTPKKLLATILIANNFVNVGIVVLSTYIVAQLFNFSAFPILGIIIQVIVITALILLIGEIIPKIYCTKKTLRFAYFMAKPLKVLLRTFQPISYVMVRFTTLIDKKLDKRAEEITMKDLSEAINITTQGKHSEEETRILKGIVQFTDIDASEIMKSRLDVIAVDIKTPFEELRQTILDCAFSRIPVFEDTFDDIKGVLYTKDLLPYLDKTNGFEWQKLIRDTIFVPENKKINDLLQEFREKKIHLAIVVDEYGGTSGIVTLEDILEEIVGEISDEFDQISDDIHYKKINEGQYIFEGRTPINDFCKVLKIGYNYFDEIASESDSIAGLMLELTEKIPQKGENTSFKDFSFTVIDADNRRIKKIKVVQNQSNKT